jgi:RNA polymerase sigma-70 factor (ECF subfamily)
VAGLAEVGRAGGGEGGEWERNDVEAFTAMLAEDATFAMPPMSTWYEGRDAIAQWARSWPMSGDWRWRAIFVRANGQPALAFYAWDPEEESYMPFALNVLTFRGSQISDVTAFIARSTEDPAPELMERMPEQPADPSRMAAAFGRFGLPDRLD